MSVIVVIEFKQDIGIYAAIWFSLFMKNKTLPLLSFIVIKESIYDRKKVDK